MAFQKRPVRSSQAVGFFGPGSLVDFPGPETLIHAGLDAWQADMFEAGRLKSDMLDLRISNEPRLAALLDVDFFLQAPPWTTENSNTLPWLRFPRWHECPTCGLMTCGKLDESGPPQAESCKNAGHQTPRQVRFIAACRNGHVRDFPWIEWLAFKIEKKADLIRDKLRREDWRLFLSKGSSAGAGGVVLELREADNSKIGSTTLQGALGGSPQPNDGDSPPPLASSGIRCRGENPVLGIDEDSSDGLPCDCDAPLIANPKGATNFFFPKIESVIHVPDHIEGELRQELVDLFEDEELVARLLEKQASNRYGVLTALSAQNLFQDNRSSYSAVRFESDELESWVGAFNKLEPLRRLTTSPELKERLRQVWQTDSEVSAENVSEVLCHACKPHLGKLDEWRHVSDDLVEKLAAYLRDGEEALGAESEDQGTQRLRDREFEIFTASPQDIKGRPRSLLKTRQPELDDFSNAFREYFDHVTLVDSLRETRAFRGFDRLVPSQKQQHEYDRLLWREKPSYKSGQRWLPAAVVFGEGFFLRFRLDRLRSWEQEWGKQHEGRLSGANEAIAKVRERRGEDPQDPIGPSEVMIHTFAHLLINHLVYSSGYGSASLRERLYVTQAENGETEQAGLLIYTAAGDAEGSMGGLVRQAELGRLERLILGALESAMWCASDPVCIESEGQGPDACNLAACHSCALLPETSSEMMNRFLDRGTVVGTLRSPGSGFFSDICGRSTEADG